MTRADAAALAGALAIAALVLWLGHGLADVRLVGLIRDDGELAAYGRALALGLGYVDPSVPGHPPAARFPIGLPLLLAALFTGAADWAAQLPRLALVAPAGLAAAGVLTWLYHRRRLGLAPAAALGLAALVGLEPDALAMAGALNTDLPFMAAVLAAVLVLDRPLAEGAGPGRWAAGGALVAAACLLRSAGLVLALAAAFAAWRHGRLRAAGPAAAAWALPMAAWGLYRAGQPAADGYGDAFRAAMPADAAGWAARAGEVAAKLAGESLPELVVPGVLEGQNATLLVLGVLASALATTGLWAWLRRPPAGTSVLVPAFMAGTIALALGWTTAFVALEENLLTRVMLPLAPWLPYAAWLGLGRWLARPLPARWTGAGLAAMVAVVAWGVREPAQAVLAPQQELARRAEWLDAFDAVRRLVPPGGRVASDYGVMTWLYTGREGHSFRVVFRDGRAAPLPPELALRDLAAQGTTHVLATPAFAHAPPTLAGTLNPILRDRPGVLTPVWVSPSGRFALLAVDRARLAP